MANEMTIQVQEDGALRALPGIEPVPVRLWETSPDGKRRPSAVQATDDAGIPLWALRVYAQITVFDRVEPTFVTLRIASATAPTVEDLCMLPMLIGGAA